jgi:hypothetical protein
MANTLQNIVIPVNQWVDLYTLSGISVGAEVSVQNIGVCDLYFAVQATQPTKKNTAFKIIQRENGIPYNSIPGDAGLWAFCNTDGGLVNVELLRDSESKDRISEQEFRQSLLVALDSINTELHLLNARFEEAFETDIDGGDVR